MSLLCILNRTPPLFLICGLYFAGLFHVHFMSVGGDFNSRNIFGWITLALGNLLLWWRPFKTNQMSKPRYFILAFLLPVLFLTLWLLPFFSPNIANTLTPQIYYIFPFLLLFFGMFILGGLQAPLSNRQWRTLLLLIGFAVLPQTLQVFFKFLNLDLTLLYRVFPSIIFRDYLGFSQENLMGSFLASLIGLFGWAVYRLCDAGVGDKRARGFFYGLSFIYAFLIFFNGSKLAVLGLLLMMAMFWAYVLWQGGAWRYVVNWSLMIGLAFLCKSFVPFLFSDVAGVTQGWDVQGSSVQLRLDMWYVSWLAFLDAPYFGHGIGSFFHIYMDKYAALGPDSGISFKENLSNPHNLIILLLVEAGLIGTVLILMPYIALMIYLVWRNPRLFILPILLGPILVHCLLEYPYFSSSSHYLIFALTCLAILHYYGGPENKVVFSHKKLMFQSGFIKNLMAGLGVGVIIVFCFFAVPASWQDRTGAIRFHMMQSKSTFEILARRFQHSDMKHSLIGPRQTTLTVLYLMQRAIEENEKDLLKTVLLPIYEEKVKPFYSSSKLWHIEFDALVLLSDESKIQALIDYVRPYRPKLSEEFEAKLSLRQ
ncbi:MAG: O-antigen ligase family protein [Parvibaculales bacterium]